MNTPLNKVNPPSSDSGQACPNSSGVSNENGGCVESSPISGGIGSGSLNFSPKEQKSQINSTPLGGRVAVSGGPAQQGQNSEFVNKLIRGQWKEAFESKNVKFEGYELSVTPKSVGRVFSWAQGTKQAEKVYISGIIESLLDLQIGRELISKIIELHHNCVGLPSVAFSCILNGKNKCSLPQQYGDHCTINIDKHESRDQVLVVRGNGGQEIDFVRVDVPEVAVLAHELGHAAYEMDAHKQIFEASDKSIYTDVLNEARNNDGSVRANSQKLRESMNDTYKGIDRRTYGYYETILRDLLSKQNISKLEEFLIECWNKDYEEILNILPSAKILKNNNPVYSDGAVIREILKKWGKDSSNYPKIYKLSGQDWQKQQLAELVEQHGSPETFIRFGHMGAIRFFTEYLKFTRKEQRDFKQIAWKFLSSKMQIRSDNLPEVA